MLEQREASFPRTWLMAGLFCAIGVARALRAIAIAPSPELPELLLLAVAGQAVGALIAGIALLFGSRSAALGLTLFAACTLLQMGSDVLVYQVRALLEALAVSVLAVGLALFGWLALERERTPRPALQRLES